MEKEMQSAEASVREIRRATRRKFSAEEKARIVLEGLRGETSVEELCRREGIVANLYYRWSKDFLEAGKKRLSGDTVREATTSFDMEHSSRNIALLRVSTKRGEVHTGTQRGYEFLRLLRVTCVSSFKASGC